MKRRTDITLPMGLARQPFFAALNRLGLPARSPHPGDSRKYEAMGRLVEIWGWCVEKHDPRSGAKRDDVDAELGAGAFDLAVHYEFIVADPAPRWTGPSKDREWLLADPAGLWRTYVIRRGDAGPVKIGRTKDLERRISEIQTGCDEALVLLHAIRADHEKRLHAACAPHRLRGEWFDGSEAFFALLESAIAELG